MKYWMGLDLSVTGAAAVVVDDDGVVVDHGLWGWGLTRKSHEKERVERLVYIADKIIGLAKRVDGELGIGIENYAFNRLGAQNDLGEIQGAVKTQIWLALRLIADKIVASSARKMVLGKGRFSKGRQGKREIIQAVNDRGFAVSDDNVADAYVIAECLRLKNKEMLDVRGKD